MDCLISFRFVWKGKLLINNPWCFDYCLDREEQRVDQLFENGSLTNLQELELSGFYQTVDNKVIQDLCYNHLSSNSITKEHLREVICYYVDHTWAGSWTQGGG